LCADGDRWLWRCAKKAVRRFVLRARTLHFFGPAQWLQVNFFVLQDVLWYRRSFVAPLVVFLGNVDVDIDQNRVLVREHVIEVEPLRPHQKSSLSTRPSTIPPTSSARNAEARSSKSLESTRVADTLPLEYATSRFGSVAMISIARAAASFGLSSFSLSNNCNSASVKIGLDVDVSGMSNRTTPIVVSKSYVADIHITPLAVPSALPLPLPRRFCVGPTGQER